MKNFTVFTILSAFVFGFSDVKAQNWSDFGSMLSQLDSLKRAEYLINLDVLQNINGYGSFTFGQGVDSLTQITNEPNPVTGVGTLLPSLGSIRDTTISFLNLNNFTFLDSLSAIQELDTLSQYWDNENENIYGLFDTYMGELDGINLPNNYIGTSPGLWNTNQDSLQNNQQFAFNVTPANGIMDFNNLFDNLFNPQYFTHLEIFTGIQDAKASYYGFTYNTSLPVLGIRSVENFDRTWESRWRIQGSWFAKDVVSTNVEGGTLEMGKNSPFMFNGNFNVMYNPVVLTEPSASTQVRVLTMFGIDAATYVPAHKQAAGLVGANNVGYTTGWGPVVGAGIATRKGEVTVYALTSTAFGDVVCGSDYKDSGYLYRSTKVEAGIRFSDKINVRYERGLSNNWATPGSKSVRYNQVTIGLPTTGLFR